MYFLPFYQAIGGAVWHGVKGFRNSPYGERRIGALTAIKARAPVLGGNFGVWGGLFSTFDCAIKGIRKKEDPYNASMFSFIVVRFSICKQMVLTASSFFSSHCRFLHWWCFGNPWWLQGRQKLCHYVRRFPGCYRRCWYWFPEDDGRQHKARREFRILCRSEL